ncbi:MAG: endolytic transglycosylase MltG [Armatimonadetes bacterium]|nr:endolytic transglycosylase MltG [Armatimonadota bacterium]
MEVGPEIIHLRKAVRVWLKRLGFFALFILLFAGLAAGVASLFTPAGGSGRAHVMIPPKATTWEIGRRLKAAGVIRSATGFVLVARVLGESGKLQAGEYAVERKMGLMEIIDKLFRGDTLSLRVTVPEGYTIERIAALLKEKKLADERKFVQSARFNSARFQDMLDVPTASLEGYLFPDTYLIPKVTNEEAIVRMMLDAFKKKVLGPMDEAIQASGKNLHKIVTMASLVEREARQPKERPMVAAVLWNRLKIGMRLQCDATVQYALGKHKSRLLYDDLKVESPYNTYLNAGLPPGPIASPGLASIEAALKPAQEDALYYVARADGSHIFTRTLDEHRKAIREARRSRKSP